MQRGELGALEEGDWEAEEVPGDDAGEEETEEEAAAAGAVE